jgi:thiol-disulfide isomerase/thioredoxin
MRNPLIVAATALLLAAAAPTPTVTPDQPKPVAAPYDTQADAHAAVDAAFAAARSSGRKVMIDFGGNWCPDCRALAGVLASPDVKPWLDQGFVTVMVDVGRFKKNLDIAAKYGVKINAAPTVLIITPDGKLLNGDKVFALADARYMSPQAVVDLLAGWEKS